MAHSTEVVRLWRTDENGQKQLTEVSRSMFPDADSFVAAIEFHESRGCEREEND